MGLINKCNNILSKHSRSIFLKILKYIPSILALGCSIKLIVFALSNHTQTICLSIANSVNVLLGIIVIFFCYILSLLFHFCKYHRQLCLLSLVGHIGYLVFMVFSFSKCASFVGATIYAFIVVILTTYYSFYLDILCKLKSHY